MRFSQRIGKTPIKVNIQKDTMDDDLRTSLWNVFYDFVAEKIGNDLCHSEYYLLIRNMWVYFFKKPLDSLNDWFPTTLNRIRTWFFVCEWYEVYDFIEFLVQAESPIDKDSFIIYCNLVFEREVSAYRIIGHKIGEITDDNEIKRIEDALDATKTDIFSAVHNHLKSALTMLTNRNKPDYRNSIKESILAVESLAKIISGDSKAELGKALKKIEDKIKIHPALKKAFLSLYGYTNDEGGIRHAMLDEKVICFEDAKYMLVSCSGFVSYLIMKVDKIGYKLLD